jgi:hypothetical protein
VNFNKVGLISGCKQCRQKKRRCNALRDKSSIWRGHKLEHSDGSWEHLAVKLQAQPKSVEFILDDSDEEPIIPLVMPKPKQKDNVLASQIEQGTSVYHPQTLALKIGSIKVNPRQPGEENGMVLYPCII